MEDGVDVYLVYQGTVHKDNPLFHFKHSLVALSFSHFHFIKNK